MPNPAGTESASPTRLRACPSHGPSDRRDRDDGCPQRSSPRTRRPLMTAVMSSTSCTTTSRRESAADGEGVEFGGGVTQQRWGLITTMQMPGGGRLGLYEPRHASPLLAAS